MAQISTVLATIVMAVAGFYILKLLNKYVLIRFAKLQCGCLVIAATLLLAAGFAVVQAISQFIIA